MNFVMGDYKTALEQLNDVRSSFMKGNPKMAAAMGTQYEVYMNTLQRLNNNQDFNKTYQAELLKKYNSRRVALRSLCHFSLVLHQKKQKKILAASSKAILQAKVVSI